MPNLYATPNEYKTRLPDGIRATTTDYDEVIYRLLNMVSRAIDRWCGREFFPRAATRYYNGSGLPVLDIDDLISVTSISMSEDDGSTYTALESTDYILVRGGHLDPEHPFSHINAQWNYNHPGSYRAILMDENGNYSEWSTGQKSVKLIGVFGYADDRDAAWEDSQDTVEDDPFGTSGTTMTVNDADGVDSWGFTPRFQVGQLARVGSEYFEVTSTDTSTNVLTVLPARNGSTAASHAQNAQIDLWRPPDPVKQACIIQAVRQTERGFQGFADARATPEIGQLFFMESLDPEVKALLDPYKATAEIHGFA